MPSYPASDYPSQEALDDFKARFPDNADIQAIDLATLIAHIQGMDSGNTPPTTPYRNQEPRGISPCTQAVAGLIVEVFFVAFDFGSLPMVAQTNARAALETRLIPLIGAQSNYLLRLIAVIRDVNASRTDKAGAIIRIIFGLELLGIISSVVEIILKSFTLLDGVFFMIKFIAKMVLALSTEGSSLLIAGLVAILDDTSKVVVQAIAVGRVCGSPGEGVVSTFAKGLNSPWGIAVSSGGNLYVTNDSAVLKWAAGSTSPVTVAAGVPSQQWPNINSFGSLCGLALDPSENVYISSQYFWVQQLVRGGSDPSKLINGVLFAGNGQGSGLGQLGGGMGLEVDAGGNLYVADAFNDRVLKFGPSGGQAVAVFGGNGKGAGANQLAGPSGVALDKNGNLYVADTLNHRVQMFAPQSNTATTVAGGRGMGAGPKQLSSPGAVAVDANLNIYVADTDNCRVMQWEAKARFGVPIAGGTGGGAAMDQLLSPRAIALSPDGKWIYVVDPGNHRIQQWASASS